MNGERGSGCGDSPPWGAGGISGKRGCRMWGQSPGVWGQSPVGVGYEVVVGAIARRTGGYFLGSGAVPLFLPLLGNFGMNGLLVSS